MLWALTLSMISLSALVPLFFGIQLTYLRVKEGGSLPVLLFFRKMIQYLCRVQASVFMRSYRSSATVRYIPSVKSSGLDQAADSPVQLFILDHPGQERFLRCQIPSSFVLRRPPPVSDG